MFQFLPWFCSFLFWYDRKWTNKKITYAHVKLRLAPDWCRRHCCENIGLTAQEGALTRIDSHNFLNLSPHWSYNQSLTTTTTAPAPPSGDSQQNFSLGHSDVIDAVALNGFHCRKEPKQKKQSPTWRWGSNRVDCYFTQIDLFAFSIIASLVIVSSRMLHVIKIFMMLFIWNEMKTDWWPSMSMEATPLISHFLC